MFKWYVVRTAVGREQKVSRDLRQRIVDTGKGRFVRDIVVPTETVNVTVDGEIKQKTRVTMPGYILANVDLPAVHALVKQTRGVIDFLGGERGPDAEPVPLTQAEVNAMIGKAASAAAVASKPRFAVGDEVQVTDGPMAGFTGLVSEADAGSVTVMIEIFGRKTPAQLAYHQVQAVR